MSLSSNRTPSRCSAKRNRLAIPASEALTKASCRAANRLKVRRCMPFGLPPAPFKILRSHPIVSVIDKLKLKHQYKSPDNPYSIAMQFCLERSFLFLREQGESDRLTHVLVESRGAKEDTDLELAFRRICDGANACGCRLPFQVIFSDKKQNLAGLQLADLVCHPIGRHRLKPDQPNRAYEVVERKIRRNSSGRIGSRDMV